MKNIHVLPTDKPSRLVIDTIENKLYYQSILHNKTVNVLTQNIYITSDEEIKKGDIVKIPCGVGKVKELHWKYGNDNPSYIVEDIFVYKLRYGHKKGELQTNSFRYENVKKIILTTDTKLINDGIQSIDDEFLEWFVKNPSCEEVEIQKWFDYESNPNTSYKIIIPKEEVKIKDTMKHIRKFNEANIEGETLEEAAEKEYPTIHEQYQYNAFIEGGKWQQDQDKKKYSEEDMIEAAKYGYNFHKTTSFPNQEFEASCIRNTQQWLTTYKKK